MINKLRAATHSRELFIIFMIVQILFRCNSVNKWKPNKFTVEFAKNINMVKVSKFFPLTFQKISKTSQSY